MASATPKKRTWLRWVVGGVVLALVVFVGGPFVYIHFIEGDPPAKLSLSTATVPSTTAGASRSSGSAGSTSSPAAGSSLAGTWTVGSGSTAGYRVKENLFGQDTTAVGRTSDVTGSMTIASTTVSKASFSVDMTTVKSDQDGRNNQFQGRIMDTAQYPTATFELTSPINLAPVPKEGVVGKYSATGKLMLHGTTKTVTIPLETKRTGNVIQVQGILSINFPDYGIDNPSGGPANVGDVGQMEFLLQLQQGQS